MKKSDRAVALGVLAEIFDGGAYTNISLRKALSGSERSAQSRAFITEMVNETVRNLYLIDHIIEAFSNTPAYEMKPTIRNILRISVCQIRFLERIPERAAVDEAVKLTKHFGFDRLAGFVNGILRSIAREPERPAFSQKDIALRFSYPPWLVNKLVKWLGAKGAVEFCENSHKPAPVTVLTNTYKTTPDELAQILAKDGVDVTPVNFNTFALRHTGDITRLAAFTDGLFIVIDPGAMAAVNALDAKPGQTILDLCAAPGGKSFAAAFQMQNIGRILAADIHAHKINLLRQTQKRLGLSIIETAVQDALQFDPTLARLQADAVLLDAPCSGIGTIRKHPEIKYTRSPEDILILAQKQATMLANAAKYVKPGGNLVYCTCTVAKEENADIIEKFAAAHPNFTILSAAQTLPGEATDGFFTAKIQRL